MTDNVVELNMVTRLDLPPDRILEKAIGKLESVLVLGFEHDGSEYFACSKADAQYVIYLGERAKHRLMMIIDNGG